ncbi:hypothetical protein CB1_001103017 [Camelus ferus]|nr:hypothetical protein CB1_001103017 [Camelus ferus]
MSPRLIVNTSLCVDTEGIISNEVLPELYEEQLNLEELGWLFSSVMKGTKCETGDVHGMGEIAASEAREAKLKEEGKVYTYRNDDLGSPFWNTEFPISNSHTALFFLCLFQEADTDENQGTLTFEEFCVFYKMMSLRRDLYLLLLSYSDKKDHLTVEELAQFLKVEQKMNNVTTDYCIDVIRKFEVSEENKAKNVLGVEGFTNFMRSPACDIFNPLHHEVYQDMDQPLCNYYIASSHNTYLTGDQLLSQSKVDMYARVLQEGCRCVEVDCWDGPDGEPVVHHGYTLTSKILFRDVVETINKHAFVKNEFPVILSIENHCSIQQQRKIAQYLKGIFRDKLDLSSVDTGETKLLPSPQSLKGKILVKPFTLERSMCTGGKGHMGREAPCVHIRKRFFQILLSHFKLQ